MARTIVITSGKGGVGKTSVTANLGIMLSEYGFTVLLIDCDSGLNNLDVILGIENLLQYDLMDVIDGRCRLQEAITFDDRCARLALLSVCKNRYLGEEIQQALRCCVDNLRPNFDFILVDCPAGIDEGFHNAVSVCDEVLVVTNPTASAIRDADKVLGLIACYPVLDAAVIVNRVREKQQAKGEVISVDEVEKVLMTRVMGVLPENAFVSMGKRIDEPNVDKSALMAFRILANNMISGSSVHYTAVKKGFFSRLRRRW